MDVSTVTCNSSSYGVDRIIIVENYLYYQQKVDSAPWGEYIGLFKENRDILSFRLIIYNHLSSSPSMLVRKGNVQCGKKLLYFDHLSLSALEHF